MTEEEKRLLEEQALDDRGMLGREPATPTVYGKKWYESKRVMINLASLFSVFAAFAIMCWLLVNQYSDIVISLGKAEADIKIQTELVGVFKENFQKDMTRLSTNYSDLEKRTRANEGEVILLKAKIK